MMLVSGSFLSDSMKPKDVIELFDKTNMDYIHVDVMDGKFVQNKSYTTGDIEKFSTYTSKPLDVHLMVKNPSKYIESLCMLNVEFITFHYEALSNHMEVINAIKNAGVKVGISINPDTNVSEIFDLLPYIDLILVMSVVPGKSGQKFILSVLYKIEILRKKIDELGIKTLISVDGGINDETILLVKDKGADMVVSSSYLLSGSIREKINSLRK